MKKLSKIVMIDDDVSITTVARIAIETVGKKEVQIFNCPLKALESLGDIKADLILLDCYMPNMNGEEVLPKIRDIDQHKETPIFFLTGKSSLAEIDELRKLGVDGVISKPFNPTTFTLDLEEMLNQVE